VEFNLIYTTSSGNFNHAGHEDLSYAAVVDNAHINLTPLGKFLMPPPMSEKQIPLKSPCQAVFMFGHTFIGLSGDSLVTFDAAKVDAKTHQTLVSVDLSTVVITREVYKVLGYRPTITGEELIVALVENQVGDQRRDRLTLAKVNTETKEFLVIKQLEVPKVYSACIAAKSHHSGYHKDEDSSGADHDNTYYANVAQSQDDGSSPDGFKF